MFQMFSGQISIIPKPELRGFWGSSLIKPPFRVTSADVVIICPDVLRGVFFCSTCFFKPFRSWKVEKQSGEVGGEINLCLDENLDVPLDRK